MACIFIDLDGTLFKFGTNTFNHNAKETVLHLLKNRHQVVFITRRTYDDDTDGFLHRTFGNCPVLYGIENPRVVINDDGSLGVDHERNASWSNDTVQALRPFLFGDGPYARGESYV